MNFEEEWYDNYLDVVLNKEYLPEDRVFNNLSTHKNIPINIIKKYKNKPWSWDFLTTNINNIINNSELPWNWYCINYEEIDWDIINKNLDKPWNWYEVHKVKNMTLDIIKSFPDKGWNYYEITSKLYIFKFIIKESDIILWSNHNLNWRSLTYCNRISFKTIYLLKDKNWSWIFLSKKKNITMDNIIKLKDKSWNWNHISEFKATWSDYINNLELPWNINYIFRNKNMTIKNLKTIPGFSKNVYYFNTFDEDKEEFIRNKWRKFFMRESGICEELMKKVLCPEKLNEFIEMEYEPEEFNYIYGN